MTNAWIGEPACLGRRLRLFRTSWSPGSASPNRLRHFLTQLSDRFVSWASLRCDQVGCSWSNRRKRARSTCHQGCSVLKDTDIIENVIKVHAVFKEFKTDILDIVFA